MRILHLTKYLPEFPGGIEQVTKSMALAGHEHGAVVEIVGVSAPRAELRAQSGPTLQRRIKCNFHVGPVPIAPEFFFLQESLLEADLIHLHLPNPLAELAILRFLSQTKGTRRPLIVPVIHSAIMRWPPLAKLWHRWIHEPLLAQSDAFLLSSEQLLDCLPYNVQSVPKAKGRIIPFAIDAAPLLEASPPFQDDTVRLLSVGRLVRYKGYDLLLNALAKVRGKWSFTLLGRGPEGESLRRQIAALGLSDRVQIIEGASEELKHRHYHDCDLFVFPSRTAAEGFGIAIGEAFAHAKPVLTTRLPTGVAFLARGGECGETVEPNSTDDLVRGLESLISDPERRARCGGLNYQFWQRELRMECFSRRYSELLSELLQQRTRKVAAG